jgi:hypothetical protein
MRNEPSNVNQGPRARTPTPPPPPPSSATNINRSRPEERSDNLHDEEDGDDEDEEEEDDGEDSMADVYSLPPPLPLAASGGGRCPRLPPAEPPPLLEGLHMDLEQTDDTPPAILLSNHMVRSEIWIRYMGVEVRPHGCLVCCIREIVWLLRTVRYRKGWPSKSERFPLRETRLSRDKRYVPRWLS